VLLQIAAFIGEKCGFELSGNQGFVQVIANSALADEDRFGARKTRSHSDDETVAVSAIRPVEGAESTRGAPGGGLIGRRQWDAVRRRMRPGRSPVQALARHAGLPLTITSRIPAACCFGDLKSAVSMTVSGSNSTRSA